MLRHRLCPQTTQVPYIPDATQRHCSRVARAQATDSWSLVVIPEEDTLESAPDSHLCPLGCLLPG